MVETMIIATITGAIVGVFHCLYVAHKRRIRQREELEQNKELLESSRSYRGDWASELAWANYSEAGRQEAYAKEVRNNINRHSYYKCTEFVDEDGYCDKHDRIKEYIPKLSVLECERIILEGNKK